MTLSTHRTLLRTWTVNDGTISTVHRWVFRISQWPQIEFFIGFFSFFWFAYFFEMTTREATWCKLLFFFLFCSIFFELILFVRFEWNKPISAQTGRYHDRLIASSLAETIWKWNDEVYFFRSLSYFRQFILTTVHELFCSHKNQLDELQMENGKPWTAHMCFLPSIVVE